jgi:hypothetical protein
MDFYESPVEVGVVPLLVECNFEGRKIGEEGWNRCGGDVYMIGYILRGNQLPDRSGYLL